MQPAMRWERLACCCMAWGLVEAKLEEERKRARRAKIRLLIDYALTDLVAPHQKIREQMVKDEKERDLAVIKNVKRELLDMLRRFEHELGDQPYLAGDFSLLDAAVVPRFLRLEEWNILPDASLPCLGKWLQRIKDRPALQSIIQ